MPAAIKPYEQGTKAPAPGGVRVPAPPQARAQDMFDRSLSRSAGEFERGADELATVLNRRAEEDAKAWASQQAATARLDWTQHLIERQESSEPGAPEFTGKFLTDYDDYAKKTIDAAPDSKSKFYMQQRLVELRDHLGENALRYEAAARIDHREDQYRTSIDVSKKIMNTDPGSYQPVLAERLAEIDAAALPQKQKSALRQKAIDEISTAAVWSQIQRNPTTFLKSIGFYGEQGDKQLGPDGQPKLRKTAGDFTGVTGNSAFDMMPFAQRTQMFQQAISLKNQIDSDGDRAVKAQAAKLAEDTGKGLWEKHFTGKLKQADVIAAKNVLHESDFKALLEANRHGLDPRAQRTDPATLRSILLKMDKDPEGGRVEAYNAHRNGLLSDANLLALRNESQTMERQGGPKTAYEQGRFYITQSMDPGPYVKDPVGKQRFADAVDDFDNWMKSAPKDKPYPDEDVRAEAKRVVARYKFISFQDTTLALPQPRAFTLNRNADPDTMLTDIALKVTKMKKESPHYADDMAIANRWRKAAEDAQKAAKDARAK